MRFAPRKKAPPRSIGWNALAFAAAVASTVASFVLALMFMVPHVAHAAESNCYANPERLDRSPCSETDLNRVNFALSMVEEGGRLDESVTRQPDYADLVIGIYMALGKLQHVCDRFSYMQFSPDNNLVLLSCDHKAHIYTIDVAGGTFNVRTIK